MAQPSSRRILAAVGTSAASLVLAAAVAAPASADASMHHHAAKSHGAMVKVKSSKKYGKILVNSSGRTLYLLTADTATTLACTTGSCVGLWPPLYTKGKPRAGKGVARHALGTVKRGSKSQVTYHGHPLYLYAGDAGRGQVNGEGIKSFGGVWYVVSKKGSPVKAESSSSGSGGAGGSGGYGGSGGSGGSGGGGYGY